jgi:uncharacterized protein YukE
METTGDVNVMGQKFDMGADTLGTLRTKTSGSSDELGSLIQQLVQAATPLEGSFNGAGKAAFDRFKARGDEITGELNRSLGAILGGIGGMDTSFREGEQDMASNATSAEGAANFDAARFGAGR